MNHYWYVFYVLDGGIFGSIYIKTTEGWFPIKKVSRFIAEHTGSKPVVISHWTQLTEQMYEERLEGVET